MSQVGLEELRNECLDSVIIRRVKDKVGLRFGLPVDVKIMFKGFDLSSQFSVLLNVTMIDIWTFMNYALF